MHAIPSMLLNQSFVLAVSPCSEDDADRNF
jgi:hypothetical protein